MPIVTTAADTVACAGCGHARADHLHYRPGNDCSRCDCERFSWPLTLAGVRGLYALVVRRG